MKQYIKSTTTEYLNDLSAGLRDIQQMLSSVLDDLIKCQERYE